MTHIFFLFIWKLRFIASLIIKCVSEDVAINLDYPNYSIF
jgi:hypothetical protein